MTEVLKEQMKKLIDTFVKFEENSKHNKRRRLEEECIKVFDFERFQQMKTNANEVKFVLNTIQDHLRSMRISQVFEDLPQTGQLLGRLCAIPELLSDETICQDLVGCFLQFCDQTPPLNPLEAKAKTWAISQLRSITNVPLRREDGIPLCVLGSDQTTLLNQISQQSIQEANRCIRQKSSFSDEALRKTSLNLNTDPDFIVYLLKDPRTLSIAESLCEETLFNPVCEQAELLLKKLSEISRKEELPYRMLCLLWLNDLASLEHELLTLVKMFVMERRFITQELCQHILHSNLGKACADHPQLYIAVNDMLDRILSATKADWAVVEFIGIIHRAVREKRAGSKSQNLPPLAVFYSSPTRSLVNLLQISPTDLQQNSLTSQIESINSSLRRIQSDSNVNWIDGWKVLIHFPEWYNVCLVNCLHADKKILESCIDVMLWYKCFEENNLQVKENLLQTISTLQSLLGKHNLKIEDLQYTWSLTAYQISGEETFLKPLIGQLLVIFIILSKSGLLIGQEALTLVCNTEDVDVQLGWLLRTVTILTTQANLQTLIPAENIRELRKLIEDYRSKVEKKSPQDCDVVSCDSDTDSLHVHQLLKWSQDSLQALSKHSL